MSEVKLTIDEVIAHCERKVDSYKSTNIEEIIEEYGLEKNFIKEYLEHKQVAEWLKELKNLRGAMERILTRLEENALGGVMSTRFVTLEKAIEIVKEEGGIE